jgi:carbon monoxide dehydrogenase subunit G
MQVGVGAVKGTFQGTVRIEDLDPPASYRMVVEGRGGPGFARGEARVMLSGIDNGTSVRYTADVHVGGLVATVGQRMLGGVARMIVDQFFSRMTGLLQEARSNAKAV